MNRKFLVGLDTETCNGFTENGKLNLSQSLVYDMGWAVVDKKRRSYKNRKFCC